MLKLKIYRLLFLLNAKLELWRWWSNIYRVIFESKYSKFNGPKCSSIVDVSRALRAIKYEHDGIKRFIDTVSYPQAVYERGRDDCDGSAIFAHAMIAQNELARPWILSVAWLDEKNKYHGHAVCMYTHVDDGSYSHIGNWNQSMPVKCEDFKEVIGSITFGSVLVGWAVYGGDLKLYSCGSEA